jgi:hypothetical protein
MKASDVPLFSGTEDAMRYGRELRRVIAPDEFQTLVRTWIVSQRAYGDAGNLQAAAALAFRVQTLREAIQAFLFDEQQIPHTKDAKVTKLDEAIQHPGVRDVEELQQASSVSVVPSVRAIQEFSPVLEGGS